MTKTKKIYSTPKYCEIKMTPLDKSELENSKTMPVLLQVEPVSFDKSSSENQLNGKTSKSNLGDIQDFNGVQMDKESSTLAKKPLKTSLWRKYRGITFSVIASLFFSLTAVIVKLLQDYHPFSVSVWRHAALLIPTIPIVFFYQFGLNTIICKGKSERIKMFNIICPMDDREKRIIFFFLVARGILGATALLLQVWALKYLSVGDTSIFTFSAPIFVVIFAHFCLGEKCGVISILVAFLTLIGVAVIVRPPFLTGAQSYDINNLKGVSLAFSSTLLNSLVIIIVRRIRLAHWALILLFFGILGVAENVIVAAAAGVLDLPRGLNDCLLVYVFLPVTVYAAQMCIMLALKFEDAGPVALVGTSGVVFSFLLQYAFFSVPPDIFSLIGSVIVVVGVFVTTVRKWLVALPTEDSRKKRFKFLLL